MKTDELQLFADNSADVSSQNTTETADSGQESENGADEGTDSYEAEFEELIKGKYARAFSKRTQGIIDKRFAKFKGYERTAKACEPLLEMIGGKFPDIDASDHGKLVEAFLGSAYGNEEDKAATAEKTEKEPSPLLRAARVMLEKKAAREVAEYFDKEQEKLREIYPSFSLEKELSESEDFRRLLNSGVSLRRAFETVNLEKIMGQALKYAAMSAGKKTADAIKNSVRVSENPLRDTASSVQKTDVNSLTEKEIMKILSQVSKGAKITF